LRGAAARRALRFAPLLVGAAATLLYLLTLQRRLFGDGVFLLDQFEAGDLRYYHPLFLPAADLLRGALALDHESALKWLSALGGGLAAGAACIAGRAVLRSARAGLCAGALVALLPGFWFHATASELHAFHAGCAALLLTALVRVVRRGALGSAANQARLAAAAALTPLSHLSGASAFLPALAAAFALQRDRVRTLLALAAGAATFGAGAALLRERVSRHAPDFGDIYATSLAVLPRLLHDGFHELLVPAVPASVLVPAGLLAVFASSRALGWVLALWIAAWCVPCFPIGDMNSHGSYYVPTYPAQAILAIAALRRLRGRRVAALAAALAPGALAAVPYAALPAWAVAAWLVVRWSRPGPAEPFRAMRAAPLLLGAFVWSLVSIVAGCRDDAVRDRIARLSELTGATPEVVYLMESNGADLSLWGRGYRPGGRVPQSAGPRADLVNLYRVELAGPTEAARMLENVRARIREETEAGRNVWVIGPTEPAEEGRYLPAFLAALADGFDVERPEGFEEDVAVLRLEPRLAAELPRDGR
jgi:hypothetical protein